MVHTIQKELIYKNKLDIPPTRTGKDGKQYPTTYNRKETQQEIAEQVGCSQRYVSTIQEELRSSSKLTLPPTRTGKDGKQHPTCNRKAARTHPDPTRLCTRAAPHKEEECCFNQ